MPTVQRRKANVALVHTGGTLAMAGGADGVLRPTHFRTSVRRNLPELSSLAELTFVPFSNLDSCEIQPEHWLSLASEIERCLSQVDGVVVTHGTDTLAYTASALSFLLGRVKKPVVLTGAQRPLGALRSDARINLIDAVTSAIAGPAEVSVCFDSLLLRGNRVRKVSVSDYHAFESPNCAPLGELGVDVKFNTLPLPKSTQHRGMALDPNVWMLQVHPGLNPRWALPSLPNLSGLVVIAYGAGNVPTQERSLIDLFREAKRLGVPVLLISEAHRHGVRLGLYASGVLARELGVINGGDMTPQAALTKMMVGLARFSDTRRLKTYLEANVAGERTA